MSLIYNSRLKKVDPICQKCPWFDAEFTAPILSTYHSQVAVIQECPTPEDFIYGEPFSGHKGDMLRSWLEGSGKVSGYDLDKSHRLLAVKCSKGDGKKPSATVVKLCSEHLKSDIEAAAKKDLRLVIPLGATATRSFFPVSLFGTTRGHPRKMVFGETSITILPTLSPGHVMARPGEEALVRTDFENIIQIAHGKTLEECAQAKLTKTVVLNTPGKVRDFLTTQVCENTVVSIDIETTAWQPDLDKEEGSALNYLSGRILAISFSVAQGVGHVFPVLGFKAKKIWSDKFLSEFAGLLKSAMESPKILWVLQNAQFDLLFLSHNFNIDISKIKYVDVMLMSHLLWEEAPKDLKTMATVHTDMGGYEAVLRQSIEAAKEAIVKKKRDRKRKKATPK